ncbi:diguanylate cyclase [Mycolicibacterium sp. P1-18]|uniref:diguanylate cyclase n=1 Tax=Mycolicibacterium sp. P1-18 TaxID=2024615 RepID=UPI0015662745|nr:diguanylate cyclase [Mycolicibacterium sp. P1-18]
MSHPAGDTGGDLDGGAPGFDPAAEQRYRRLVDHSPDAIVVHVGGRLTYVNPAGVRWMAADSSDQLVGHLITEFVHPDSIGPMLARIGDLRHDGDFSQPSEAVMLRFDGTLLDVEAISVLTQWGGEPAYQVVFRDLTAQKAAQAELRRVEQHFATVVASLDHGVVVLGTDGRVASANPAAHRIVGVTAEAAADRRAAHDGLDFPLYDTDGRRITAREHPVAEVRRTGDPISGRVFGVDRIDDGQRVWLSGNISLLEPSDPLGSAVLVSFADVTAQRLATERLTHQATHDSLTGLPNRAHALSLLDDALQLGGNCELAAVLFIDVDNLKHVNDNLGHDAGDEVLRITAQCLRRAVRSGDLIARFGGDEFIALLLGPISRRELAALADGLHASLSAQPVAINGVNITIRASTGIVVLDEDAPRDAGQILHHADTAMYQAKTTGRGTSQFGDHHSGAEATEHPDRENAPAAPTSDQDPAD